MLRQSLEYLSLRGPDVEQQEGDTQTVGKVNDRALKYSKSYSILRRNLIPSGDTMERLCVCYGCYGIEAESRMISFTSTASYGFQAVSLGLPTELDSRWLV
jgi:hypothetical protein